MPIPVKASSSRAPSSDAAANVKPSEAAKSIAEPVSVALLSGGSNIAVFLKNLRLLNLDQRCDWPSICTESFSTKGAQQNQKHRIRCTEWALYRLFEIWDVEETHEVGTKSRPTDRMIRVDTTLVPFRSFGRTSHHSNPYSRSIFVLHCFAVSQS